jgi:hypothetical protein
MRNLALLWLLTAVALSAFAAKRVTVEKLEQVLDESRRTSDAKLAQQIYDLELTERLSEGRLARLETDMPGPLAREALIAVADASTFLDLPARDIPALAAPDPAAQSSMLALTTDYVHKTIHKLPNFFATRETTRFEDTPIAPPLYRESSNTYEPLHEVGRSSATAFYRNGSEVVYAEIAKGNKSKSAERELSTRGVFGPILSAVLVDSANGAVTWSHWEEGPGGLQAVFSYRVPQQASHYTVGFRSEEPDLFSPADSYIDPLPADRGAEKARHVPAYHGEIAVNPADGTIMRLTLVADLKSGDPIIKADLMVEYGSVELGGKTYICPVKSVALSLDHIIYRTAISAAAAALGAPQLRVNDELFNQYHLFRADAHILTGAGEGPR